MRKYLLGLFTVLVSFSAFADCSAMFYGAEIKNVFQKQFPAAFVKNLSTKDAADPALAFLKDSKNWIFNPFTFDDKTYNITFETKFVGKPNFVLRELDIDDNSDVVSKKSSVTIKFNQATAKMEGKKFKECNFLYYLEEVDSEFGFGSSPDDSLCVLNTSTGVTTCKTSSDLAEKNFLTITVAAKDTPAVKIAETHYRPYN